MGKAGVDDRTHIEWPSSQKNLFEWAKVGWEQQGVLLGEAFPPAYSAGSGSSSPEVKISRVDDSGTTRAPSPFFWTFG